MRLLRRRSTRTAADTAGDRCRAARAAPGACPTRAARPCAARGCGPCPESSRAGGRWRSSCGRASPPSARRGSAARCRCRRSTSPRPGSARADRTPARARTTAAASARPTAWRRARRPACRGRCGSRSTNRDGVHGVERPPHGVVADRRVARAGCCRRSCRRTDDVLQHEPEQARAAAPRSSSRMSTPSIVMRPCCTS